MRERYVSIAVNHCKLHQKGLRGFARINAEWHGGMPTRNMLCGQHIIHLSVLNAVRPLLSMVTQSVCTVQGSALRRRGGKEVSNYYEQVLCYKTIVKVASEMLEQGIIFEKEFTEFEQKIAEKYGIKSDSLFRNIAG